MANLCENLDGVEIILEGEESLAEDNEEPDVNLQKQAEEFEEEEKMNQEPKPSETTNYETKELIQQLGPFENS